MHQHQSPGFAPDSFHIAARRLFLQQKRLSEGIIQNLIMALAGPDL